MIYLAWKVLGTTPLLQVAANATLRSETLRRCKTFAMSDASNGSDFNCVCDAGHTVQFSELFATRKKNRNGKPDEGVCDVHHTVHSDELFVIRQHKRNGQPDQGVRDVQHTVHSDELFVIRQENRNGSI